MLGRRGGRDRGKVLDRVLVKVVLFFEVTTTSSLLHRRRQTALCMPTMLRRHAGYEVAPTVPRVCFCPSGPTRVLRAVSLTSVPCISQALLCPLSRSRVLPRSRSLALHLHTPTRSYPLSLLSRHSTFFFSLLLAFLLAQPFCDFLTSLHEMTPAKKRSFLLFVLGCPHLPPGGLCGLSPPLEVRHPKAMSGVYIRPFRLVLHALIFCVCWRWRSHCADYGGK